MNAERDTAGNRDGTLGFSPDESLRPVANDVADHARRIDRVRDAGAARQRHPRTVVGILVRRAGKFALLPGKFINSLATGDPRLDRPKSRRHDDPATHG
jgi:hypothetical protein